MKMTKNSVKYEVFVKQKIGEYRNKVWTYQCLVAVGPTTILEPQFTLTLVYNV